MLPRWHVGGLGQPGTFLRVHGLKCVLKCELGLTKGPQEFGGGTFHGGTDSEGRRNSQHHVSVGRSLGYRGCDLEKPVDRFGLEGVNGLQWRNTLRESQVEPR